MKADTAPEDDVQSLRNDFNDGPGDGDVDHDSDESDKDGAWLDELLEENGVPNPGEWRATIAAAAGTEQLDQPTDQDIFELVESDDEGPPVLEESSDDEDEPVKMKSHEDASDEESEDESLDAFFEAIRNTAQIRQRTSRRSVMTAATVGPAEQTINLFSSIEVLNALPTIEPEFLEIEMTLDTGASVHAMDKIDLPGFIIEESAGSKAGQKFQASGGKFIDNEGQAKIVMLAPAWTAS